MAAKFVEFTVTGDPAMAKATAEQTLTSRKFRITWNDDRTATAARGSKAGNILAGSFARYYKIGVEVRSAWLSSSYSGQWVATRVRGHAD
jgi:hypothetical protein